jgi:hypothetical protein
MLQPGTYFCEFARNIPGFPASYFTPSVAGPDISINRPIMVRLRIGTATLRFGFW